MTTIASVSALREAFAPLRLQLKNTRDVSDRGAPEFALASLLVGQGLVPLWSDLAESGRVPVSNQLRLELAEGRRAAAARYLLQRRTAERASACLTAAGIRHAVFKGVATRESLYADPAVRVAVDIDILVAPDVRERAISALVCAHYHFSGARATIGLEASLTDKYATIDLHWAVLRPGRCRCDLQPLLLATARPRGSLSVLSDDANLLVMLVHPAFAKHVNGSRSKLIRTVDLDRMLRTIEPDWDWILSLIDAAGLRTAVWAVLHWQRLLMETPVDSVVLRHLEPGRLKRRYLAHWIEHQLPARLDAIPGLVQGAFSLALHEHPGDALRALAWLLMARLESGRTLRRLQRLSETSR